MASAQKKKATHRHSKAQRTRQRIRTNNSRPRLSVFRSLSNIYGQVIDDASGRTLASASSLDKDLRGTMTGLKKTAVASQVGKVLAQRAKAQGVTKVVFDRGAFRYHGRVKALAEAAREAGLQF